jgi:hypothetical protein
MEDINLNVTAIPRKIPKEGFHQYFQQWQDWLGKCVCACARVCVCVTDPFIVLQLLVPPDGVRDIHSTR